MFWVILPALSSVRQTYPESRECKRSVWTTSPLSSIARDVAHSSLYWLQNDVAFLEAIFPYTTRKDVGW